MDLYASLKGPDGAAIFRAAAALPAYAGTPSKVSIDNDDVRADAKWLERCLADGEVECTVTFSDRCSLGWKVKEHTIYIEVPDLPRTADATLSLVGELPFELASFKSLHKWFRLPQYKGFGFGGLLVDFGWGCALKGAGHDRLVSRRWLTQGPWRLVKGVADTSLVQFHDLDASLEDALAEAAPGHRLLGNTDDTGFLTLGPFRYRHDLAGLYEATQRRHKIVVAGRDVSHREMLEACRARALPKETGRPLDQPIEQFAFVFMEDERANVHVHDLWARGLECWAVGKDREVRLDDTYAP